MNIKSSVALGDKTCPWHVHDGKCPHNLQVKINLLSCSKGHIAGKQYLQAAKRFNTITQPNIKITRYKLLNDKI